MVVRVRGGPPKGLVVDILNSINDIDHFVETGTFRGETALWASHHFEKVTTIEVSKQLYDSAVENYGNIDNIHFIHGDSAEELEGVVSTLSGRSIFWLDAHYMEVEDADAGMSECPLLDELEKLRTLDSLPIILIDDARYFISPPPTPFSAEEWPNIVEVIDAIDEISNEYYVCVSEGVIIAVPESERDIVVEYAQKVAADQWWVVVTADSDIARGLELINAGILEIALSEKVESVIKTLGLYPMAKRVYRILGSPTTR